MTSKPLINIARVLLFLLICAYFMGASTLTQRAEPFEKCLSIEVVIEDSLINRFVSPEEVKNYILTSDKEYIGICRHEIDLFDLENYINKKSAVKKSRISIDRAGVMRVYITQRRPVARLQTATSGVYIDSDGDIFPLMPTFTSYIPVITGEIPVDDKAWLRSMVNMALFLEKNDFWGAQIQQIDVAKNGDLKLYPRVGDHEIIFGTIDNMEQKFGKLFIFYQNIVPVEGWNKYSSINVKYTDQLVCKKRN